MYTLNKVTNRHQEGNRQIKKKMKIAQLNWVNIKFQNWPEKVGNGKNCLSVCVTAGGTLYSVHTGDYYTSTYII